MQSPPSKFNGSFSLSSVTPALMKSFLLLGSLWESYGFSIQEADARLFKNVVIEIRKSDILGVSSPSFGIGKFHPNPCGHVDMWTCAKFLWPWDVCGERNGHKVFCTFPVTRRAYNRLLHPWNLRCSDSLKLSVGCGDWTEWAWIPRLQWLPNWVSQHRGIPMSSISRGFFLL